MEWLNELHGKLVGLDTAPLIYFIEEHPTYLGLMAPFFEALDLGQLRVVTSTITLTEVLVLPLRSGARALANEYRDVIVHTKGLEALPLSLEIAELAAQLRAIHNLRTPDAIQLATALHAGAECFLTNDARLPSIPGLPLLVLASLNTA